MPKTTASMLFAALLAAPLAVADWTTPGVPDFGCQAPIEWAVHDYGAPAAGAMTGYTDGNLEECAITYGFVAEGREQCARLAEDNFVQSPGYDLLCRTDRPKDFDGDREYAVGGAQLVTNGGPETSPTGATRGAGGLACLGARHHHDNRLDARVVVTDALQLADPSWTVLFTLAADWSRPGAIPPDMPDCGDGLLEPCDLEAPPPMDNTLVDDAVATVYGALTTPGATCNPDDSAKLCFDSCKVLFRAGADGSHLVFVHGLLSPEGRLIAPTQGHVRL